MSLSVAVFIAGATGCDKLANLDQAVLSAVKGKVQEKVQEAVKEATPPAPASPSSNDQPRNVVAPTPPPSASQDSDTDLKAELNGYVECINRSQSRARDSYGRYLSWVSKSGPTCGEPYITYGLYSLYDDSIEKCNQAAKRGAEGAPSLPVAEKAAQDLAACNAELIPLVKKASDYYDQQDYKDDKCVKAKEMHPQLIATFEKCFAAAKMLTAEVDKLKVDLDKRELAKLQAQGQSLQAQTLQFLIGAKELLKTINTEGAGPVVSKDVYTPKCLELEKTFQALDDYGVAHKDEVDKTFWGSAFISSAKEFTSSAKFLRRDLDEGKDAREKAQDFVEHYNRMIGDSNNLRF
jgi:hypothetical protein